MAPADDDQVQPATADQHREPIPGKRRPANPTLDGRIRTAHSAGRPHFTTAHSPTVCNLARPRRFHKPCLILTSFSNHPSRPPLLAKRTDPASDRSRWSVAPHRHLSLQFCHKSHSARLGHEELFRAIVVVTVVHRAGVSVSRAKSRVFTFTEAEVVVWYIKLCFFRSTTATTALRLYPPPRAGRIDRAHNTFVYFNNNIPFK